ncbi:cytochrome c [Gymnodinialimonas sp. 2305UL16-5]|uniref:c-type cytochrome n=1 Tax=Gymnodinialimonas mytili TaxID=3126503 RepID=UPI0030A585DE
MTSLRSVLVLLLLAASPAMAQNIASGAALYADHCAVCHGTGLLGDGPMAEVLVIPPPNLRRIEAESGFFPRVGVAGLIDGRDPLAAHGGDMPIFGRIFGDFNEVMTSPGGQTVLTSQQVVDLVDFLETQQD